MQDPSCQQSTSTLSTATRSACRAGFERQDEADCWRLRIGYHLTRSDGQLAVEKLAAVSLQQKMQTLFWSIKCKQERGNMGGIRNPLDECRGGRIINKSKMLFFSYCYFTVQNDVCTQFDTKRLFSPSSAEGGSFSGLTRNRSLTRGNSSRIL